MTHAKITQAVATAKEIHRNMLKMEPGSVERLGARTYRDRHLTYARDMIDALALEQQPLDQRAEAAIRTLERLGYTYEGGELWKPPLGVRCPIAIAPARRKALHARIEFKPEYYRRQMGQQIASDEQRGVFDYDPQPLRHTAQILPDKFARPIGSADIRESGFTTAQAMIDCLARAQHRVDLKGPLGYDHKVAACIRFSMQDPHGAFRPGQFISFVRRTDDVGNFVHERCIVLSAGVSGMRIANVDTALEWQIDGHTIGMGSSPSFHDRVSAVYPLMPTEWAQTCLDNYKRNWLKEEIRRLDEQSEYSKRRELMVELASVGMR